jgi:3-methyladenine DNA glycosylase AlkC
MEMMKDRIGKEAVLQISNVLSSSMTKFDRKGFISEALNGLDDLELKQRVNHLVFVLSHYLPTDFSQTEKVFQKIINYWHRPDDADDWFSFAAWPLTDYVAIYGIQHPQKALILLKMLTPLFTAEFAIRPFIEQHFDLTYLCLLQWTKDEDEHVRRLCSEGIRPRLPWGKQLTRFRVNPEVIFPILEKLKDDPSLYVRRSVANNLNDIAKDNPDKVIALCRRWMSNASPECRWIIKHGLRSLVKAGCPAVFPLLGYEKSPQVKLKQLVVNEKKVRLGEEIALTLQLVSTVAKSQNIVLDYKVHHVKANGKRTSKVFKWKNVSLESKQQLNLTKKHVFRKISTRIYYAGYHTFEILLNGHVYGEVDVELVL